MVVGKRSRAEARAAQEAAGVEVSVSNLPTEWGESDIRMLFSRCGEVRAVHQALEHASSAPSGVATVVMATPSAASAAQQQLHKASADTSGTTLLNVWKASAAAEPDPAEDRTALYIRGVPPSWPENELRTFLSRHGTLEGAKMLPQRNPDPKLAPALGRFVTREDAERTLQAIHGTILYAHSPSDPESTTIEARFADSQNAKRARHAQRREDSSNPAPSSAPNPQAQHFPNIVGGMPASNGPPPSHQPQPPPPAAPAAPAAPHQPPPLHPSGNDVHMAQAPASAAQPTTSAPRTAAAPPPPATANQGTYSCDSFCGMARQPQTETPTRLHVRNLPADANELYLYRLFAFYGAITHAKVISDPNTQECKGYGFVTFRRYSETVPAIQYIHGVPNGQGKHLHVEYAHGGQKGQRGGGGTQ